ncbi:hypothetical protein [Microbacterium paludicola]|uniref:hypothetical protein n=1 Tax=Microbacterium paludicola TaxID=300019 RepID=UPI0011A07348|nr:hypothetical protein [Microbacterium paludicola]
MAARRLPRGTRLEPVVFPLSVEKRNRDRWKEIADLNGISSSAMFDAMVENIELDLRGRPTWLPERPPKDGELPIDSA